ncbi:DUF2071 domain-containing protein [Glycomyces buryatensis]|uniref:DUF2071 domain-containing protein n=1 Tax=Glycomyces buryatensis TaxID=2570927 RepID=A0A4S8PXS7_9ACTN|nr:DUF2071 domain-containing protein [Glycomyces buryatensis]THV36438.1 DUF2071 domain-containing protein [Glycomyces buryatensis]
MRAARPQRANGVAVLCDAGEVPDPLHPEPVTPDPPRPISRPLLTQSWLDLAFLHWAVDPEAVAGLLPTGTVPDTFDGATFVGLIAFRMHRVGWLRLPGIPYFGSFPETNVRLYSVDRHGRRGVVFRSLDASRLAAVLTARAGFGLPYLWSRMDVRAEGDSVTYTGSRRWPGPRGAHSRITGAPMSVLYSPGVKVRFGPPQ